MAIVYKAFRYRIYPTHEQEIRLCKWESALRWLWNTANEQRLTGMRRTDKRYPTAFDQINELTELRAELPWLADVPRNVCAQLLVELDVAWQRCFKRLARTPRWKRKGKDFLSFTEPHPNIWRLDNNVLHFPKLKAMRAVRHRKLEGKPKRCTLRREDDQWFASVLCEVELVVAARTEPVVALDRGITYMLASSDGVLTSNPQHLKNSLVRLARAQRVVNRRKKGSKRSAKARQCVVRIHRKVRRQREHTLHVESARIAKSHGVVVIEKLNIQGMVRGNLSRSIADVGWARFAEMLRYKLAWSGGFLISVPAQYSSQTCSMCGTVAAGSRRGEHFCCAGCGYVGHADLNAAKVLKQRFETPGNPWCLPVEGSLLESARRSGKAKVALRTPRRVTPS